MMAMNRKMRLAAFGAMVIAGAVLMSAGLFAYAQEIQLPFTWKGDGEAWAMIDDEVQNVKFTVSVTVDQDGMVKGTAATDDGEAKIERFYYTQESDGLRRVVFILLTHEADNEPLLYILDGKTIKNKFFFGEALIKKFEKEGAIEKGLNIGDKAATEIYEDYIPDGLKKALKSCRPVGCVKIIGKFAEN